MKQQRRHPRSDVRAHSRPHERRRAGQRHPDVRVVFPLSDAKEEAAAVGVAGEFRPRLPLRPRKAASALRSRWNALRPAAKDNSQDEAVVHNVMCQALDDWRPLGELKPKELPRGEWCGELDTTSP